MIAQRGNDFGARLANAHADAADGLPVLQIGMDTPQVTAELLAGAPSSRRAQPANSSAVTCGVSIPICSTGNPSAAPRSGRGWRRSR
ncbi:hypothetical protein MAHJHV59_47240 [Mycobacterium avium subsp. hominissuis]